MSPSPIAVLRDYTDNMEAETVRIRLAAAGIPAFVTGTDAATALGLGGAATWRQVQVKVPLADVERAMALLEEDRRRLLEAGPWICSRCREQNEAAFDVCWSCDKPRTDDDERGRLGEDLRSTVDEDFQKTVEVDRPRLHDDLNPYRPVLIDSPPARRTEGPPEPMVSDTLTESATRCFRAAVVGAIILPPLFSFYSVYLLVRIDTAAYRIRGIRKKILIAWCINSVNIVGWLLFYRHVS